MSNKKEYEHYSLTILNFSIENLYFVVKFFKVTLPFTLTLIIIIHFPLD